MNADLVISRHREAGPRQPGEKKRAKRYSSRRRQRSPQCFRFLRRQHPKLPRSDSKAQGLFVRFQFSIERRAQVTVAQSLDRNVGAQMAS
jgi:hypothetical protein